MRERLLKEQEGMMTVEAAVIVPAVSFILVGVVFFFLFFLDISVAKSEAMRIASETAAAWKSDGSLITGVYDEEKLLSRDVYFLVSGNRSEMEGKAQKRMASRMDERLLVSKRKENSVTVRMNQVKVEAELCFRWPLPGVEKLMGELLFFSCTVESPLDNWEEQLRLGASLKWK